MQTIGGCEYDQGGIPENCYKNQDFGSEVLEVKQKQV